MRPCYQLSHDYTCFHYGRQKRVKSISFGKVQEKDLITIWDSDSYRTFRELVEKFPFFPAGIVDWQMVAVIFLKTPSFFLTVICMSNRVEIVFEAAAYSNVPNDGP